jgi:Cu+-exporting ATPase
MDPQILNAVHIAEFVLATPVLFFSGSVFFRGAYFALKNKTVNMDTLVASGATLTYMFSFYVMLGGSGYSYFDSVVMIITFVLVGKYLEKVGKKSAIDIIDSIKASVPVDCEIIQNNKTIIKLIDEIEVGDIVLLKAGQKAPVDGVLTHGVASFDESSISGESAPVPKDIHDQIISGTIVIDGTVRYQATTDFAHSSINEIIQTMENSLTSKPKIEQKANQLSKYFSTTILLVSLFTFVWWLVFDSFEFALITSISVIVIACPCALALSTPMAVVVGIGRLAKCKILFKEAKYLESLAQATTVVFDKTGTLTRGQLSVVNQTIYEDGWQKTIAAMASSSTHPISQAVSKYLYNTNDTNDIKLENIQHHHGKGISATYQDSTILAGSAQYLETHGIFVDINTTYSLYCIAVNDKLVSVYELKDELKTGSLELINYLKKHKKDIIILSGDRKIVVDEVAKKLNIENRHGELSPIDKADFVAKLRQNQQTVVMIGDGINDAVALARADVSISMISGSDISVGISDIVILDNSPDKIIECFKVSKLTYKHIKQNLGLSLVYNTITIPLAMMGYVIPLVAALSMSLSSLLVVANSLRIKWRKS